MILTALAVVVLLEIESRGGEGHVKRFPETVSPNGSYYLAWGDGVAESGGDPTKLTELPYGTPRADLKEMAEIQDYLLETRRVHGPMPIPKITYFSGIEGHEVGRGMTYTWSPDSAAVLVIYESPANYLAAMWVDVEKRRVTDLGSALEGELRRLAAERFGRDAEKKLASVSFARVSLVQPGILTIDGLLAAGGGEKDADSECCCRMRFWVTAGGAGATMELVKSEWLTADERKDEPFFEGDGLAAELTQVLASLRASLHGKAVEELAREQAQWLHQREAMPSTANEAGFTRHRIEELRIRAEEKAPPALPVIANSKEKKKKRPTAEAARDKR